GNFSSLHEVDERRRKIFGMIGKTFPKRLTLRKIGTNIDQEVLHGRLIKIRDKNINGREKIDTDPQHKRKILRQKNFVAHRDARTKGHLENALLLIKRTNIKWTQVFTAEVLQYLIKTVRLVVRLEGLSRLINSDVMIEHTRIIPFLIRG